MPDSSPCLHHLALRTPDVAGLARFYQEWLGCSLREARSADSIWLRLAGGGVLMIERRTAGEPEVPPGSLDLLAFAVTDAERAAMRQRLTAAGRLEGETAHTLYFRDPDGRRVGVSSYSFA